MAAQSIRLQVNNDIFSWAVRRAGFSKSDIAKKYPHFTQWISGEIFPTVTQLKDFSKYFHFPFGYFFLNTIPQDSLSIPMFRSFEHDEAIEDQNIKDLIKLLSERQEWLSDYLKADGADKNNAVGLFKDCKNIFEIKQGILSFLGLEDGWQFAFKTPEQAIKHIVSLLEENNIFVTFNSVVNFSNNRQIPVKLCRGFCLVDDYAPFIFVNSADSKKAQLFTLLHELAHIFISFSSGCGDFGIEEIDNEKERLCDKVAAEFLVPKDLFLQKALNTTNDELSALFKVSEVVILRRKLDLGLIDKDSFFAQYNLLPKFSKKSSGGGDFYLAAPNKIGSKFLRCLNIAMQERKLTPMEAYHLAGVKGNTFIKLTAGERR